MEERRFDDLTRALGRGASRRQVLKGLVAGLVGALVGRAVVPEVAEAAYSSPQCDQRRLAVCEREVQHIYRIDLFSCAFAGAEAKFCQRAAKQQRSKGLQDCAEQFCSCPDGKTACGDARRGTCCDQGEVCKYLVPAFRRYSPYQCVKTCDPPCGSCETCEHAQCIPLYCPPFTSCCNGACLTSCPDGQHRDPETCACTDLCANVTCDNCHTCDPATGECVAKQDGAECGSGLACCGGRCQAATDQCDGGGFGGDDCPDPICQQRNAQNICVPVADGTQCGSCGQCASGTCVANPSRTCATCYECNENGNCVQSEDNTTCGSNEVCCGGTCQAGASCGPCSDFPNGHQCPADVNGNQTCCYGDSPCCADDLGNGICGPTDGVCCPVGTTLQCGPVCCDLATEQCSFHGGPETGTCCPKGQVAIDDGTCCPEGQTCGVYGSRVCCPSGQQCATDPEQTVFICCSSAYAGSDSVCCPESFVYAHCADGADICCGISQNDEECCTGHGGPA